MTKVLIAATGSVATLKVPEIAARISEFAEVSYARVNRIWSESVVFHIDSHGIMHLLLIIIFIIVIITIGPYYSNCSISSFLGKSS